MTDFSVDGNNELVMVRGSIDQIALAEYMQTKFKRSVEVVQSNQEMKDEHDDDDDKDNNGGDKNDDGGANYDSEGNGGGEKVDEGVKLEYLGKGGLGYRYGYHAGFEEEYPVGKLHVRHVVNGDNKSISMDNMEEFGDDLAEDAKNIKRNIMHSIWYGGAQSMFCPAQALVVV